MIRVDKYSSVLIIRLLFVIVNAVPFSTCRVASESNRIFEVLEDIIEHTLINLHIIQKNLLFWQSTAEVSINYCLYCGGS